MSHPQSATPAAPVPSSAQSAAAEAGGVDRVSLIARHDGPVAAVAGLDGLHEPRAAEVAFAVTDDFSAQGLGCGCSSSSRRSRRTGHRTGELLRRRDSAYETAAALRRRPPRMAGRASSREKKKKKKKKKKKNRQGPSRKTVGLIGAF